MTSSQTNLRPQLQSKIKDPEKLKSTEKSTLLESTWAFAVPLALKVMVRTKCKKKKLKTITISDYQNKLTREKVKNPLLNSQIKD